jgi:hypothetical protein
MSEFQAWAEKNKALWTRVYDEVIAPGFEKEWEKSTWRIGMTGQVTDKINQGKNNTSKS